MVKTISSERTVDFIRAVTCQVCDHLLSDPVQSPCRHLFCRVCILRYSHALGPNCPSCNQHLNPSHLIRPAKFFLATLNSLPLLCPREGCSDWVRLDSFKEHCLNHYHEKESQEDQTPSDQNIDGYLPVNKGGRPRQHLLSLTRRAQKHRLKDLKNQLSHLSSNLSINNLANLEQLGHITCCNYNQNSRYAGAHLIVL
uniref:V(D)J recombination-activating protein 1 n=1 Tax=Cyprinus carpio TaxID=7962 RepID=A0A8C2FFY2_CYPCA